MDRLRLYVKFQIMATADSGADDVILCTIQRNVNNFDPDYDSLGGWMNIHSRTFELRRGGGAFDIDHIDTSATLGDNFYRLIS